MKTYHVAAALAAATLSTAAFAQPASRTTNSAATTASPAPATRDTQRVCIRVEATGTNVRPLVCRTRGEWRETEGFVPGERPSGR